MRMCEYQQHSISPCFYDRSDVTAFCSLMVDSLHAKAHLGLKSNMSFWLSHPVVASSAQVRVAEPKTYTVKIFANFLTRGSITPPLHRYAHTHFSLWALEAICQDCRYVVSMPAGTLAMFRAADASAVSETGMSKWVVCNNVTNIWLDHCSCVAAAPDDEATSAQDRQSCFSAS